MSEETMEINDLIHAKEPQTPGDMLRQARLQLGYSEADVALQLHLSRNIIDVLENNQYQKLPALTFAKGYLRSYAKLVLISPDTVIEAFEKLGFKEKEHNFPQRNKVIKEFKASEGPVRWISYTILAGLAALVVIWWHNHNANNDMLVNKIRVAPTTAPIGGSDATQTDQVAIQPVFDNSGTDSSAPVPVSTPITLMPAILTQQNNTATGNMNTLPDQNNAVNSQADSTTAKPHEGQKEFQQWRNPDRD